MGRRSVETVGKGTYVLQLPQTILESQGGSSHTNKTKARIVGSRPLDEVLDDPLTYLLSNSDAIASEVQQVHVKDKRELRRA